MAQVRKMQDAVIRDQEIAGSGIRIPHPHKAGRKQSAVPNSEFLMHTQQGERLLQMGRAGEAERVFRDLLARLGEEPSYRTGATLARLGRCLRAQGRQDASG